MSDNIFGEILVDALPAALHKCAEYKKENDILRARIAELEAARRWVPVGERLPNRGQTVYGWIHPVSYVPGHGKEMTYMPMLNPDYPWRSTWDMATYSALDITHWQPLPPEPEEE